MKDKQGFFFLKNQRVKMNAAGYRTTGDAVALAAAAKPAGGSILDVGIGAGGVALCLLDDNPNLQITGIDVSAEMLANAAINAKLNGRDLELLQADIMNWKTNRLFDFVITNPPYFAGSARADGAHHNTDIEKWTAACVKRLRARGQFWAITDAGVFDKIVAALVAAKCGGITIRRADARIIISARLGVKTPAKIEF